MHEEVKQTTIDYGFWISNFTKAEQSAGQTKCPYNIIRGGNQQKQGDIFGSVIQE